MRKEQYNQTNHVPALCPMFNETSSLFEHYELNPLHRQPHQNMEAIILPSKLSNFSGVNLVYVTNHVLFDPIFGHEENITLFRRILSTWIFLYVGALAIYFLFGGIDFLVYHVIFGKRLHGEKYLSTTEVQREIKMSVKSLSIMSGFSVPAEVLIQLGYSKEYTDANKYGYLYLIISPILFILFSDCMIYFVHRALHTRTLYKYIHKPHHSFINTTPFAAFAFHPIDGYMQGIAYHIFVFVFPFHSVVHLISLVFVSMWTINIHDRVSFGIPGINGAGHHTIHHTTFKSNYGQYFTLWDKICGTFRDPNQWKKQGAPTLSEKQVYGKDS